MLTYDYNILNDLRTGNKSLNDNKRSRNTHTSLLESTYGINNKLSITTLFSLVRQERNINNFTNLSSSTSTFGIGDAVLLLKYNLIDLPKVNITVGAGPKIPLGSSNVTDKNGFFLPADLQPGTGAWDAIFWSYIFKKRIIRESISFSATTLFRYTRKNNRYNETQLYQFGNEFLSVFGFSNRFILKKTMADLMLLFRLRHVGADRLDSGPFPNTGGTFLSFAPGFNYNINPSFATRLTISIPMYKFAIGTQVTTSYRLTLAFHFKINKK